MLVHQQITQISSLFSPQARATLRASICLRPWTPRRRSRPSDRANRLGFLPDRARVRSFPFAPDSGGSRQQLPSSSETECRVLRSEVRRSNLLQAHVHPAREWSNYIAVEMVHPKSLSPVGPQAASKTSQNAPVAKPAPAEKCPKR